MVKPSRFIKELAPYKITPQDVWSASAPDELLKLDWNESPIDFDFYRDELRRIANDRGMVAWYPDYLALELTDELSRFVGIDSNLILAFPGSDVGLETLCRAYLEPDDQVLVLCPTYENFFVYVLQTGASLHKLQIEPPFVIDVEAITKHIEKLGPAKAVYIARPNNPIGYMVDSSTIELLATMFSDTMVIIDEAYIEFADGASCALLVETLPNVVVARTFSKAFGMAGMRLGYLCASLDVVNTVNKIRNGKNVSMLSQRLGLNALRNFDRISEWIDTVKDSRRRFSDWCGRNGVKYYTSEGNFVLLLARRPNEVCSCLKAEGIYVRNRNSILPGAIRVTIGSTEHVQRLIDSLSRVRGFL